MCYNLWIFICPPTLHIGHWSYYIFEIREPLHCLNEIFTKMKAKVNKTILTVLQWEGEIREWKTPASTDAERPNQLKLKAQNSKL